MKMKKFVIGFGIFLVYVVYSIGMRHERPIIAKPKSLLNTQPTTASANTSTKSNQSSTSSNGASTAVNSKPSSVASTSGYKDGTFTGSVVNAYYGNVQVSVAISGGKITDVKFLQYPNTHSTSVYINQQVMPYLKQEAIQSQNSHVQIISGATFTSEGFIQSLQKALSKA